MRHVVLFLSLLFAASCKDSDAISNAPVRGLAVFCNPAGASISCTAFLTGPDSRSITSEALWLASDPSLGSFGQPGLFVPTRSGDVGLSAWYQDLFSAPPSWFFVNPPESARVLLGFSGVVREEGTNVGIAGAEVQILDGHSAGARATTNSVGVYNFNRGQILTGEAFSIMASKEGYLSSTKTLRIDYPITPHDPDFLLRRLP